MTARDISGLKAESSSQFPDNTSQEITPSRKRSYDSDVADSALNVAETSLQTVAGPVDFIGGIVGLGLKTKLIAKDSDWPSETFIADIGRTSTQLEANTAYLITAPLDFGIRTFYIPPAGMVVIRSMNRYFSFLSQCTDTFVTARGACALEFMNVIYTGAATPAYIEANMTNAFQSFVLQNGFASDWGSMGTFENVFVTSFRLYTAARCGGAQWLGNSNSDINSTNGRYSDYSGKFLDFTGAENIPDISIVDNTFSSTDPTSTAIASDAITQRTAEGIMNISANIFNGLGNAIEGPDDTGEGLHSIVGNVFKNGGASLSGGITTKDLRVVSSGNTGLRDSKFIGTMYYDPFPDTTQIQTTLATDTPVILLADFVSAINLERWSVIQNPVDADPQSFALRYDGGSDFEGTMTVNLFGEETGAGSPDLQFACFKNGLAPAVDDFTGRLPAAGFAEPSGSASNITIIAPIEAAKDDYFDFRVIRRSGNNNWQTRTVIITIQ